MSATLNIIHLASELFDQGSAFYTEALSRQLNIESQVYQNKITNVRVWDGIIVAGKPFNSICRSHKRIVQDAKEKGLPVCLIAEDDFRVKDISAWNRFLADTIFEDYDILTGGISGGEILDNPERTKTQPNEIRGWSGLFLYAIHSRFYSTFLSADEEKNIDRWLSGTGLETITAMLGREPVYKVCIPIVATTKDGYSYNKGEYVNHDKYFKGYNEMR